MTKRNLLDVLLKSGILPPDMMEQIKTDMQAGCGCAACYLDRKVRSQIKDPECKLTIGEMRKMYDQMQGAAVMAENMQNLANMVKPAMLLELAETLQPTHPVFAEALELLAQCVDSLQSMAQPIMDEAKRNAEPEKKEEEPAPPPAPDMTVEQAVAAAAGRVDMHEQI